MANDVIIKFYTGTASQIAARTAAKDTCIGLQTDTGKLFWKQGGVIHHLKVDWQDVAQTPQILTEQDIEALFDAYLPEHYLTELKRQDKSISLQNIAISGSGTQQTVIFPTASTARPCWLKTTNSLYSIQPQSVSIQQDGTLNIQLSRYMAYQNVTTVPSGWKLCYR